MSDPRARFFIGLFVAMNLVLTPIALILGFEDAPWTQIVLFTPAIAALVTGFRFQFHFADLGLGLGKPGYLLAGFVVVAAYAGLTVILGREVGAITFATDWDTPTFFSAMLTHSIALESLLWAFGEELGWRGFLSEHLRTTRGPGAALWGVWALWFGWHLAPLLAFGATVAEIASFATLLLALTAFLNMLRHRSGSLWPAVVAHTVHNQLTMNLTDRATTPRTDWTWAGELGVGTAIIAVLVVAAIHALWPKNTDAGQPSEIA
jgi:membrane protease YdiL (CAAX protease family)